MVLCQERWTEPEIIASDSGGISIMSGTIESITGEIYFIWWSWYIKEEAPYLVLYYIRQDKLSGWTEPVQLASQTVVHNIADPSIVINSSSNTFSVFRGISKSNVRIEKFVILTEYDKYTGEEIDQITVFQVEDTTSNENFLVYDLVQNSSGDIFTVTDYLVSFEAEKNSLLFRSYINENWSEVREIPIWDSTGYEYEPSICIDKNDNLHLVFVGQSPENSDPMEPYNYWRVYYINSPDNGETWSAPVYVNQDLGWHARMPQIVIDSNNIRHILWNEDTNGDLWPDAIYYSYPADGIQWSYPRELSHEDDGSYPLLAVYHMVIDTNDTLYFQIVNPHKVNPDGRLTKQYIYGRENTWHVIDIPFPENPDIRDTQGRFIIGTNKIHSIWIQMHLGDLPDVETFLKHHWKTSDITSTKPPSSIPDKFIMSIYPNPFNASTSIQFSIPKSSMVSLTVYDMLGRKVDSIMHQNLERGNYNVRWDGNNSVSGIYFIKIVSGDFINTQKVVLLK